MTEWETEKEKLNEVENEVTPFYKEAFDCFDWNHSGRISTNVRFRLTFISSVVAAFNSLESFSISL